MKANLDKQVEVLSFRLGDNLATVATDGVRRHVSQIIQSAKDHPTLSSAISYLESLGYSIDTSNFQSL